LQSMIDSVLGKKPCNCGTCLPVHTRSVEITPNLHDAVRLGLNGRPAIIIGDANTLQACGTTLVERLNEAGVRTWTIDLASDGHIIHADDTILETVKQTIVDLPDEAVAVAVGSGTINDLVKAASHDLGRPYFAIATAASMNGYTSAIASITVRGLKRTISSTPPLMVFADPVVLAESPARMAISGLADLLSKPVSGADWKLDHLLWGEPYCPGPSMIPAQALERAVRLSGQIGAGSVEARLALLEALLLSGISMAVAGVSSPASGGEHLISHFLDMTAAHVPGGPRTPALHGEQVGVATRVTYNLWVDLISLDTSSIDWERARKSAPGHEEMRRQIDELYWLPKTLRDLLIREGTRKLERTGEPEARLEKIRSRWEILRRELITILEPADRYVEVLPTIGAPVSPEDLGVDPAEFANACRMARWARDRYTILDLVGDLGFM